MKSKCKYGYCPYCGRYIPSQYNRAEHKRMCKNASPEVREINTGKRNNIINL